MRDFSKPPVSEFRATEISVQRSLPISWSLIHKIRAKFDGFSAGKINFLVAFERPVPGEPEWCF